MSYSSILFVVLVTAVTFLSDCTGDNNLYHNRQHQILDIYNGILHTRHFQNENNDFPLNADNFHKPELIKTFLNLYKGSPLPSNGIFTTNKQSTKKYTLYLFHLFYFAKNFETLYKTAIWARNHLNPLQVAYAFTTACLHREDCKNYVIPPLYEILPNYFTPIETMHELHDTKMLGIKEGVFTYNNTGYEYNYNTDVYGGPLSNDAVGHSEFLLSYLREDIGMNNWFGMKVLRFPTWMQPERYGRNNWFKRGETFYYSLQQLFAIYTLHRLANRLPYVETLEWEKPIKVGYNPRIAHFNGKPLYSRPDNMIPKEFNTAAVHRVQKCELRITSGINSEKIWDTNNATLIPLNTVDGVDLLAKMIFGMPNVPNGKYFGNYFADSIEALGSLPQIGSEHELVGTSMSTPATVLRDPAFYQYLNRLIKLFQEHKKNYPPYTSEELSFDGVKILEFEIHKLVTYFERFEYDITNDIPMKDLQEFQDHKYFARQYRFNHEPYNFKIILKSDRASDAMIRVFIGPKFDSERHLLSIEQSRLTFVEIDRFPVKLFSGENVFERNSKDSKMFSQDPKSIKNIYEKVANFTKNSETLNDKQEFSYEIPDRFQLPKGKKSGQPFVISVVVTPYIQAYSGEDKDFYAPFGSAKLYDKFPLGFPFDRPIEESNFHVPNIFFKDVLVYHTDKSDSKIV